MIIQKEKTMVLKCSTCGTDFSTHISIFNLGTTTPFEAFCPSCGEKAFKISITANKQLELDVNCFFCCNFHKYKFSPTAFWKDELFSLSCGAINMDICMIGEKKQAEGAMKELNNNLDEIQAEFENEITNNTGSCMLSALNHMYDLAKDGKVLCLCDNPDIKIEACETGVDINCKSCGTSDYISVKNDMELKSFLAKKSVVLVSETNTRISRKKRSNNK